MGEPRLSKHLVGRAVTEDKGSTPSLNFPRRIKYLWRKG